jgi:signal peptidase I
METREPQTLIYKGPSMNPSLKPGDQLWVKPYNGQKIKCGDVVVFISPRDGSGVVHRVVSSDSSGIRTQGDNNNRVDPWLLSNDQILGRVFSLKRNKRRRVFGGPIGQLFGVAIRAIKAIDVSICSRLRPAYDGLAKAGGFRRWLPNKIKTKVISFDRTEGTELQLLLGRRVIGRWLPGKNGWHIRRPFRLVVDEEALPENPSKGSVVRGQLSVANEAKVSGVRFQVSGCDEEL